MEYVQLGRTGLKVSRVCLGTMNFGPYTTEADSFAIMDEALKLGINFFDTANVYGRKLGEGVTEQIIGRWFAQGGGRREKTVIATALRGRLESVLSFATVKGYRSGDNPARWKDNLKEYNGDKLVKG